jgi:hypothetical protein
VAFAVRQAASPDVFLAREAAVARQREQLTPPGYDLGKTFGDVTGRAVEGREESSPKEIANSGLFYSGGTPNRYPERFAGENRDAVALLGMQGGRSFYSAANDQKNPGRKQLGDAAQQLMQFNESFGAA